MIYIIGDIHGEYQKLLELIAKLPKRPSANSHIFNIYGHTNVSSVVIGQNFVSLDTGCGRSDGCGKLSAYCVETKEVVECN